MCCKGVHLTVKFRSIEFLYFGGSAEFGVGFLLDVIHTCICVVLLASC